MAAPPTARSVGEAQPKSDAAVAPATAAMMIFFIIRNSDTSKPVFEVFAFEYVCGGASAFVQAAEIPEFIWNGEQVITGAKSDALPTSFRRLAV